MYYWTVLLILDDSYILGKLTILKIDDSKYLDRLKSRHFGIIKQGTC